MKKSLILVTALCPVLLISLQAYTQQVTSTAGGSGQSGGNTINWTLGETVTTTLTSVNTTITQGFHQPTLGVTSSNFSGNHSFTIDAYPNPMASYVVLELHQANFRDFQYQLYDMNGKLLEFKRIERETSILIMEDRTAGFYILKILHMDKEVKSFEIIKR